MADRNDFPIVYRRRLSEPLGELLSDSLSELTRERQTALMIAASVALLLSFGLATLGDVDTGLVKLNLSVAESARWLVFAVTGYLFVDYLLGVVADLLIARVKRWSYLGSIADVKGAIQDDVKQRIASGKVLKEQLIELQGQQATIRAEWKASVGVYEPTSLWAIGEEIDLLQKYGSEKAGPFLERMIPISKKMNELTAHIPADDIPGMLYEQRQLTANLDWYVRLRRSRLAWEVVFPLSYGLFALVWTATHPYIQHHPLVHS